LFWGKAWKEKAVATCDRSRNARKPEKSLARKEAIERVSAGGRGKELRDWSDEQWSGQHVLILSSLLIHLENGF
jgi:hypothetical protein